MRDDTAPVTVDRRYGPYGEVVPRRHGGRYEIIANGCLRVNTSDGRSERRLVGAALAALPDDRDKPSVPTCGLGVGFSPARAADERRRGRTTVVERKPAIIDRYRAAPLAALAGRALSDPRVEIIEADPVTRVRRRPALTTPRAWTSTTAPAGPSPTATAACTSSPKHRPHAGPALYPAASWLYGPPNRPPPSTRR